MRLDHRRVRLPANPGARLRRALVRRPWLYWVLVIAVAAVTGSIAYESVRAVEAERQTWGSTTTVHVSTRPLARGDSLDGLTVTRDVPIAVVPDDAVDAVPDGAVARHDMGPGEMLSEHDITGAEGARGLAPAGWPTVAIIEPIPTGANTGTRVAVAADGAVLAASAIVVGTHGDAVLVAVPDGDAPAVAAAAVESRAALLVGREG